MKNFLKVKYVGNLEVYRVDIGGETYIFGDINNYTIMFEESIAKRLVQENPNIYKLANDTKNVNENLELKVEKEELKEKKIKGGEK